MSGDAPQFGVATAADSDVDALVERLQAEIDAEAAARAFDAAYRLRWVQLFEAVMGVPYGPFRAQPRAVSEVERVAAKYADGGTA
jgi:hypothetical protein